MQTYKKSLKSISTFSIFRNACISLIFYFCCCCCCGFSCASNRIALKPDFGGSQDEEGLKKTSLKSSVKLRSVGSFNTMSLGWDFSEIGERKKSNKKERQGARRASHLETEYLSYCATAISQTKTKQQQLKKTGNFSQKSKNETDAQRPRVNPMVHVIFLYARQSPSIWFRFPFASSSTFSFLFFFFFVNLE